MKKISLFVFERFAKKYRRKNPRKNTYVSYEKAKRILLIFEYTQKEDLQTIRNIIYRLREDKKDVFVLGFSKMNIEIIKHAKFFNIFKKQSFPFLSKPEQSVIEEVKSEQFDLLIDLTTKENPFLLYLVMYANVLMKVGTKKDATYLFDFILNFTPKSERNDDSSNTPENQILFDEIIFHLKNIRSKD